MTSGDGAHLCFPGLEPTVGLHSVMDGRPHLFHNLPLPPRLFTLVLNCTAWWQRHMGVNNLPRVTLSGDVNVS